MECRPLKNTDEPSKCHYLDTRSQSISAGSSSRRWDERVDLTRLAYSCVSFGAVHGITLLRRLVNMPLDLNLRPNTE